MKFRLAVFVCVFCFQWCVCVCVCSSCICPFMDVCSCKPSGIFVCLLCDLLLVDLLYCAFFFSSSAHVCMCVACHSICSYEHVLYGYKMEVAHFTNVCGSPVFWEFCVWCGCRRKAALFCACVCLCVVWSKAEKSLGSHGNKWQDLVWWAYL